MRKLGILVLALALVVGMSFGVVAQYDNEATVEQIGGSNLTLEQIGDNSADIDQSNDASAGIYQKGSENTVDLTQVGAEAGIVQFQTEGAEVVVSQGEGSDIDVVQMASPNMKVDATQSKNDEAYIVQYDANEVILEQGEGENLAVLYQDSNIAPGDIAGGNIIKLNQYNGSNAAIYQDGQNHTFKLEQYGSSTFSSNMNDDSYDWNHPDQSSVTFFKQDGKANEVLGLENSELNTSAWAVQTNSTFTGQQIGNHNTIRLHQGNGDFANIDQTGNDNKALLFQAAWTNNSADITQNGDDNSAEVVQR